jgi:class 3 adenylate cyclase
MFDIQLQKKKPIAQPNHAVLMTRFARVCIETMHDVVNQLAISLGSDTLELQLRVGLNSGKITAGGMFRMILCKT